jgi:transcription elongation factor SPT6
LVLEFSYTDKGFHQHFVEQFLADKDVGERVFRPSSRGLHYLTLTVKVFNGLYVHKDIIEDGKNLKDISSMLDLGKTLKIGDDIYKDLDEVGISTHLS